MKRISPSSSATSAVTFAGRFSSVFMSNTRPRISRVFVSPAVMTEALKDIDGCIPHSTVMFPPRESFVSFDNAVML